MVPWHDYVEKAICGVLSYGFSCAELARRSRHAVNDAPTFPVMLSCCHCCPSLLKLADDDAHDALRLHAPVSDRPLPCETPPVEKTGRIQAPPVLEAQYYTLDKCALNDSEKDDFWTYFEKGLEVETDSIWKDWIEDETPNFLFITSIACRHPVASPSTSCSEGSDAMIPVVRVVVRTMPEIPARYQGLLRRTFEVFRDAMVHEGRPYGLDVVHETLLPPDER